MLNLVIFGPPGSGKGTQAKILAEKFQLLHISTGDLLRNEIKNETNLGIEAKKFMDQGILVPDEVVIGMISARLDEEMEKVEGFIFDGFPRTVEQANALDELLEFKKSSISRVLSLKVDDNEVVKRLLERGKTSGRSDDLDEDTIRYRIVEYENKTAPVAHYYEQQGKYIDIEGVGSVEEINENLSSEIDLLIESE